MGEGGVWQVGAEWIPLLLHGRFTIIIPDDANSTMIPSSAKKQARS